MFEKQLGERGGRGIDFLINMFIVGGIGFFIFLQLWNSIAPDLVTQVNNLEGDNDSIILVLMYLIPLALAVRILREALKGSEEQDQRLR